MCYYHCLSESEWIWIRMTVLQEWAETCRKSWSFDFLENKDHFRKDVMAIMMVSNEQWKLDCGMFFSIQRYQRISWVFMFCGTSHWAMIMLTLKVLPLNFSWILFPFYRNFSRINYVIHLRKIVSNSVLISQLFHFFSVYILQGI
jgi:hypothetical protein